MKPIPNDLSRYALFASLTLQEQQEAAGQIRLSTRTYARGQVVGFEEDPCEAVGIVASGSIHIQRIFPSGKLITIETFQAGDSFGEALVFSDRGTYPATLVAREDTQVLFVPREEVVRLCTRYPRFLENFMRTLSNRILLLNARIKNLSFATVRQKVANHLLEEQRRQGTSSLVLTRSRTELADLLGIPRPSLSRELSAMQSDGWIDFDRRAITILDQAAIEQALER